MSINMSNDKDVPIDADGYYERVASQEEIYLAETEEELRAIWISYHTSPSRNSSSISAENRGERNLDWGKRSMSDANNDPCIAESLDEQLNHAAEDLIAGDSDDPPLSEEAVVEMVRLTQIRKNLGQI
jgi:hypothetical protein